MMDEGRLGLKTGSGFYDYAAATPSPTAATCWRTLGMCATPGCGRPPAADRMP